MCVQIERKGLLGKGSFGETYLALLRGKEVAVKCVRVNGDVETRTFLRELEAMTRISNPNVMGFYGTRLLFLLMLQSHLPHSAILDQAVTTQTATGYVHTLFHRFPQAKCKTMPYLLSI